MDGSNDNPTVSAAAPTATLVEAGGVDNGTAGTAASSITLTKGDVDGTASYDSGWLTTHGWSTADSGVTYTHAGTYGTATLTIASNTVSYALDNTRVATQGLTPSDHPTETFTVAVKDNLNATASTNVVFTIDGSNDNPTVSAVVDHNLVEAGGVANGTAGTASATATITKADVDGTVSYDATALVTAGWTNNGD